MSAVTFLPEERPDRVVSVTVVFSVTESELRAWKMNDILAGQLGDRARKACDDLKVYELKGL